MISTKKSPSFISRLPSALVLAASFDCVLDSQASAGRAAMITYGLSGVNTPYYRLWNGTTWGSEATANTLGATPQWIVLRGSPINTNFALAALDNDNDIEVQLWDGSAWGSVFQATNDTGDKTTRLFDLAYEQLSGEILLMYRENGTSQVRYCTHNGTSWSAESSYTLTGATPRWVRLVPKPNSDQILVLASNDQSSNSAAGALWNGSSFTDLASTAGEAIATEHLSGSYESSSGHWLTSYSVGTSTVANGVYTTFWAAGPGINIGATPRWTRMCSEKGTDAIFLAALDGSNDINVVRWGGSSWGSVLEVEAGTATTTRRAFDIAFEARGSEALLVYDESSSTLQYRTWNGSAWSAEADGPSNTGSPLQTIQAVSGQSAGHVFVTYCTDTPTLRTVLWNGSSFDAAITLGTSSAPKEYEPFMAATAGRVRIVRWAEVDPYH